MKPRHLLHLLALFLITLSFACKTQQKISPSVVDSTASHWDQASGTWYGSLNAMGTRLPLILHLSTSADSIIATMDSPKQKSKGIAINTEELGSDSLLLYHSQAGMRIRAFYDRKADEMVAIFQQNIITDTIAFGRDSLTIGPPPRPQHPTTFPYRVEELTISHPSDSHTLAGTLTLPEEDPIASVVLVSGSGPNDRDETILDHKIFLVLSDFLTRKGIAVLRYDDRGIGESTGNHHKATTEDLSEDAAAVIDYLRNDNRLNTRPIGLMGHSEGGMIAWIANGMTELDFIVSLAGPGLPIKGLMENQFEISFANAGATPEQITAGLAQVDTLYSALIAANGLPISDFISSYRQVVEKTVATEAMRKSAKGMDESTMITSTIMSTTTPWFRYFINHDPRPYLRQVRCPVLAVNGTVDQQVTIDNLEAIKAAIESNGNPYVDIQAFENINHLFQYDPTGLPSNYGSNEETFNENVLYFVSDWIHALAADR